jgi:thioredoxin-related protein
MKINLIKLLFALNIFYSSVACAEDAVYSTNLLDSIALSESSDKDILVIFTASWCKYCSIMKKDLEEDQGLLDNKIVCYVDFDSNPDLVKTYRVKTIPDYFILKNKIEIKRKVGYTGKNNFVKWFKHDK